MPPITNPSNPVHLSSEKLSLGCPILDRLLNGGLPFGLITELSGESSSGKTQLCLQLLLSAASPLSSAASLFISSSPLFPLLRRLLSLSPSPSLLDHIFLRAAFSPQDLFDLLTHIDLLLSFVPLSSGRRIRLLILDSPASIFQSQPEHALLRAPDLFALAAKLKHQAKRFNLAVVVTNHVVDVIEEDPRVGNYLTLCSSGRIVCPAMGFAWANCVNMRLFLSRSVPEGGNGVERKLRVVFAPHLGEGSCEFVIRREGVFGVHASLQ